MNYQRCKHCGELWDSSGRYTSPANQQRDAQWWREEHESGRCLADVEIGGQSNG